MAGGFRPGAIDDLGPAIVIDDGTLARTESPLPGWAAGKRRIGERRGWLAPWVVRCLALRALRLDGAYRRANVST